LVKGNSLVDQLKENVATIKGNKGIFDSGLETSEEPKAFRPLVEIEDGGKGLEFGSIRSGRLGLTKFADFVFCIFDETTIGINVGQHLSKLWVLVPERMVSVDCDFSGPSE
jgi:hypothetical protein